LGKRTAAGRSPYKPSEKRLFACVMVDGGDGFRQWNVLGASMHAVLRVGAILNAPWAHECRKPFAFVHRARGMHVEEPDLADDGRADEFAVLVDLGQTSRQFPQLMQFESG
jgi:hypothetical protein